jgi:tRNA(fMet)-specific endonuclease VapC
MILLDTDHLTHVQRGSGREYERLALRLNAAAPEPVGVTIVSFEEQMRGWLAFVARARTLERKVEAFARLRALLEDFQTRPVLDFDSRAVRICKDLSKLKTRIGAMDLQIAAIALANDALLLSRNLRDFGRVPGLRVEDWTAEANP